MVHSASTISSLPSAPASRPRRSAGEARLTEGRWALGLTLLYFCVAALGIANHEMWGDEVQAWMLARDSGSVPELLRNARYEGHPAAWHLLLWVLSRFTRDPAAMQVLHLGLATAAIYLLARFAPLPRSQKALIAFGYFFLYEYAVISRVYVLGVLGVFAFCLLFPHRRQSYLPLALVLFLVANTSAWGLMLALALGATLLFEWVVDRELRGSLARRRVEVLASIAIVAAGVAVALVQIIPPRDAIFTGSVSFEGHPWVWDAGRAISRVWIVYAPIPDLTRSDFWETNLLHPAAHAGLAPRLLSTGFSLLIVAGAALLFARHRVVLFLFLLGTGGMLFFLTAVHLGGARHAGHLFVLFIACLWLARLFARERQPVERQAPGNRPWERYFIYAILLVQLLAGAIFWTSDLFRRFSAGRDVALMIQDRGLDSTPLYGYPALTVNVVSAYLDRRINYLDVLGDRFDSFVPLEWHRLPDFEQVVAEVQRVSRDLDAEILVILGVPLRGTEGLLVEKLGHFPSGLLTHEYFVYRIQRMPDGPDAQPGASGSPR